MPTADELLNAAAVRGLARCLTAAAPGLDLAEVRRSAKSLTGLALRERSDLVRAALLHDLPAEYTGFETIIRAALPQENLRGWMIWPITSAASQLALTDGSTAAFDSAMALLADLTPRLTAEFGIRPLLDADLDRALPIVLSWTTHVDEHVRRLASEGTRPLLPWAKRVRAIVARPASTVPILHALYRDESDYVRRSVANHLNDISRGDPDLAASVAAEWLAGEPDEQTRQLVRHGLRTLIKKGHPQALALLGFTPAAGLTVDGPTLTADTVPVGQSLEFSCTLTNTGHEAARLAIDYVIHHRKANGSLTPKVFKLTTKTLAPNEAVTLTRAHSFKVITTRVYHPGQHTIELQVNGETYGKVAFDLLAS
ncbi:MAG: alkylation repair protein [Amycolatopsis sp.]|uniref:DNA alkylation repair protein n=1 Tax=Amycolatopsis sp. TaxID=37632 RepID=UPI0026232B5D|nr:DNA alkylation repair protein [Amycolatopsis sp.]MCU1680326.1 alkylation repair protein [Amycolatopsis sp.]